MFYVEVLQRKKKFTCILLRKTKRKNTQNRGE